jgi:tetratricopeptide (TPR) repeat protein
LHQRIGEALERTHSDGAAQNAFCLATHFERGGDPVRAITYLAAAAAEAQRRFAPREAIGCLEAALRLIQGLPDAQRRRQREIDLRVPLSSALNLVYGYASNEVGENCERTRVLCEQNGSLPELYEVLYALWYSQVARGEKDTTRETTERLVEIAERLGSPEHRLRAASARGRTLTYEASYHEASDTLHAVIAAWEASSGMCNGSVYGADPIVVTYAHRGWTLWFLGYPDSARQSYRKALELAHEAGLPFTLAAAHVHAALVELLCGNAAEAFRLADQGAVLTTEHAFPFWRSIATAFRGWAQMRLGKPVAGDEEMRTAITLLVSCGAKLMKPLLLALLAEGCLRLGNLRDGQAAVDEGLHLTRTALDRFYEPELWRLKGELLRAQSKGKKKTPRSPSRNPQSKDAEQCFQRALTIAREGSARSLELRAAMSLARLEQMEEAGGKAHDLLAGVYGWFTEGHDTLDLQEARTLLG